MGDFDFTFAHVGIAGLALDVAGAIVLGWAFSTKKPHEIREEAPLVERAVVSGRRAQDLLPLIEQATDEGTIVA